MDRNDYINQNFQHLVYEKVKRKVATETYEIEFMRFDLDMTIYSNNIIVCPSWTYIPTEIINKWTLMGMDTEDMIKKIMIKFEAEFTMKYKLENSFDKFYLSSVMRERTKKMNSMAFKLTYDITMKIKTNKLDYFFGFLSSDLVKMSVESRFLPMECEINVFNKVIENYFIVKFCSMSVVKFDDIVNLKDQTEEELLFIREFGNTMFKRMQNTDQDEMESLFSDYRTTLMEATAGDLSYKKFTYWERSRHNIFGQYCMKIMNMTNTKKLDVNIQAEYGYYGEDSVKTPDMIYISDKYNMIIDFAVTTRNAGDVREEKIKKYSKLAEGLSKFWMKEVRVDAIVWRISNKTEFQIPSEFVGITNELILSEELSFLYKIHLELTMKEHYEKYRVMSENEDDEDYGMLEKRLDMFNTLMDMKLKNKKNFMNMKTVCIDEIREKERGEKKTFTKFVNTKCEASLKKATMMNDEMYLANVSKLLQKKVQTNDFPDYMEDVLETDEIELTNMVKEDFKAQFSKRKEFNENPNFKMPKLFKFPLFQLNPDNMPKEYSGNTPDFFYKHYSHSTDDDTIFYNTNFDYKDVKEKEKKMRLIDYNQKGIGIDKKLDSMFFENMIEFMEEEPINVNFEDSMSDVKMDQALNDIKTTRAWTILNSISDLYFNLAYLEGRRHIFEKSKGHTVFRNCGSYLLMVKRGSKLTSQKQIRFKMFLPRANVMLKDSLHMHTLIESKHHPDLMETTWLAASVTDIRHFVRIKETAMAIASNYYDKERESSRGTLRTFNLKNKELMTYFLILMEHKRGTSTTLQLNRYLMHSITSYISNKKKIIQTINDDPIRSMGESYMRILQMNWMEKMIPRFQEMSYNRVLNLTSTSNEYDRLYMPSFFNNERDIEFSLMMDEIYSGNLFDKEAGFTSHRIKQIVEKMEAAEMHYHSVKMNPWSWGEVEDLNKFLNSKDELHMFDRSFVISATRKFFEKKVNKVKMKEAILEAMAGTIDSAMMMTSSLVSGPYESEALKFNRTIEKTKSFLSLYEEVSKLSSNMLMEICNKFDVVEAIFAIFPKAQIGGPREILIQSVMLRMMVKFLETISKKMCSIHEKEMLTKSKKRAEIQSEKMAEMREKMRVLKSKNNSSVYFSVNSDASRWSPGFVMENFMNFVYSWEIPEKMKNLLMTVIMSFSSKRMLVPDEMKSKWEKKSSSEKEFMEGVESFRQQSYNSNYAVEVNSGMGQGMFHYLSSFYHCVMDDTIEEMIHDVLGKVYNVSMVETSLISSDDKTKMSLMVFGRGPDTSAEAIKTYVVLYDLLHRMANIHVNWKKSGLNFLITEFNSLFSVGKRMTWATIKDLYTSNLVPDLTSPEEAVIQMNSNIRRCMEHGVYLTTIKILMDMARNQLKAYYRYSPNIINQLCNELNCSEDLLPFQLGFYPTTMPVETLIYGPEVHMFNKVNTERLNQFYLNLYTAPADRNKVKSKKVMPFSEESKGKYWFELPTRLDKKLKDIKEEFFNNKIYMSYEKIVESMERNSLNINLVKTDMKRFHQFTKEFFVGMNRKYEFQETMVVHSLVRALQMTKSKGIMYPKETTEIETEEEMKNLKTELEKKIMKKMKIDDDLIVLRNLNETVNNYRVDILSFTKKILNLETSMSNSSLMFYKGMAEVVDNHYDMMEEMETFHKIFKYRHPTMKNIRFYTREITNSVSSEEMLNFLFDLNYDSTNSATVMLEDLIEMSKSKMTKTEILENPFNFIQTMMNNCDNPMKSFKDFLDLNYKSMKFVKINMIAEFYDEGNMKANIMNMYMTKQNPSFILEKPDLIEYKEDTVLEFLTNISMGIENPKIVSDAMLNISLKDSKLHKAMKLHSISNSNWTDSMLMEYSRFEYNVSEMHNMNVYTWTNLNTMVKAREYRDYVDVYMYSTQDLNTPGSSKFMLSMLDRFLLEKRNLGKRVKFMTKTNYVESYSMSYNKTNIMYKTRIIKLDTKWMLYLDVKADRFSRFKDNDNYESSFKLLTDQYTVDGNTLRSMMIMDAYGDETTIDSLLQAPPDITELDRILMNNNWIKEIKMKDNMEVDQSEKFSVKNILENFGTVSQENTMTNILTGLKRTSMLEKDSSDSETDLTREKEVITKNSQGVTDLTINKNLILELSEAIKRSEENMENENENIEMSFQEKTSLVRVIDQLLTEAVLMSIDINKTEMKRYLRQVMKEHRNAKIFHNTLFWQIRDVFDYMISDNMAFMIYTVILKNYVTTMELEPTVLVKKFPKSVRQMFNESNRFIKLKGEDQATSINMRIFE